MTAERHHNPPVPHPDNLEDAVPVERTRWILAVPIVILELDPDLAYIEFYTDGDWFRCHSTEYPNDSDNLMAVDIQQSIPTFVCDSITKP
jgi:hypothetical protein